MTKFIIPAKKNRITEKDVSMNWLRITVDNKHHFPVVNTEIEVEIDKVKFQVKLTDPSTNKIRSYRLHIGKEAISLLGLRPLGKVEVTKVNDHKFMLKSL